MIFIRLKTERLTYLLTDLGWWWVVVVGDWVVGGWVVDWWWVVGGGCVQLTYAQSRIYTYEITVVTAPILYWI